MALAYLLDPNLQYQDVNGVNNVSGFLRVYYEGTDDRATTYKNFIGTMNPADIPIDNYGRAVVIVEDEKTYRLEVYSRNGNLMWTQHPLCALVGGGGSFEQVQSNWKEEDPTSAAFIKNKPDLGNFLEKDGDGKDVTVTFSEASERTEISTGDTLSDLFGKIKKFFTDLAAVAFTGSYDDLSGKPSIPAAQVNSDWDANSGVEQILNKPDLTQYIPSSQKGAANGVGSLGSNSVQPYSEQYKGYTVEGDAVFKLCRIPKDATYAAGVSFVFTSRAYNKASGQVLLWISPCEHKDSNVTYKVVNLFSRANDVTMQFFYDEVTVDGSSYVDVYYRVYGSSHTHVMPLWMRNGVLDMLSTEPVTLPAGAVEMTSRFFNVCAAKGGVGSASVPVYIDNAGNAAACTPQVFVATYNETEYSDVENAYFSYEQVVFCRKGVYLYQLKERYNNKFIFEGTVDKYDGTFDTITLDSSNVWSIETHSVDEYCVYRKSYDALHPLSTATTAADISNGYMDVEFDLGNADGFAIGDGNTLVFVGIPNKGGPSGVDFADAFTKVELYAINENDNPFLAAKVKDPSKDDYGDTLAPSVSYMWNRTYSGNSTSMFIVKKFKARYYLNMNMAWVPNLATNFYIYFTVLL